MDKKTKPQELKTSEERLDDAIESTFPASDPISISPSKITIEDEESAFQEHPLTQADLIKKVDPKVFAKWGGIAMILIGAIAYLIPGPINVLPQLQIEQSYGLFLNWFPMNVFNKGALLLVGLMGLIVVKDNKQSLNYARGVAGFMTVMAVLGLIPSTSTFFGYIPLFGGEVVAHAAFAVVAFYFALYGMPQSDIHPDLKDNDPSI